MEAVGMRKTIVRWLGREFIFISCEGGSGSSAADQMEGIFHSISQELQEEGLTLDNTIRSRLWAVDRKSRDEGSQVRTQYNSGQARAATSSFIMPGYFASDALVGLDLVALRPAVPCKKRLVESIPPRVPVSHIVYDSLLVLSGKTVVLPSLSEQLDEILPRIGKILSEEGSGWDKVVQVSCYLHRSQTIENLQKGFAKWVKVPPPRMEIAAVEGYSEEGKLIEVEVTAQI